MDSYPNLSSPKINWHSKSAGHDKLNMKINEFQNMSFHSTIE